MKYVYNCFLNLYCLTFKFQSFKIKSSFLGVHDYSTRTVKIPTVQILKKVIGLKLKK